MSKVQYKVTKFITRITEMESLFNYNKKKSKMNNKKFKHYKSQNDSHDDERSQFMIILR